MMSIPGRCRLVLMIWLALLPLAAGAASEARPMIEDPVLEERVMRLSLELRCLVCQGQSLADSHSDFALDMRRKILELMQDGMTDQQVVDYLVARYGDFIRFRPPMKPTTALLWFGPLILVLLAFTTLLVTLKNRRRRAMATELSEQERRRLESLLREDGGKSET